MKSRQLAFIVGLVVLILLGLVLFITRKSVKKPLRTENLGNMKLTSSAFIENGSIPARFTCDAENINPPLTISKVPAETKSLALIVDDPDAPAGDWTHWLVWNIDPKTNLIEEDSVPNNAIEGKNSFGNNKYTGPCPPPGTHHYQFKLYALDTIIELPTMSNKAKLEETITGHILAQSKLVGTYSRTNK